MKRYTLSELQSMPTLAQSQTDDLKVQEYAEGQRFRVWLSRMTIEDGAAYDHQVTVERYSDDKGWETSVSYRPIYRTVLDQHSGYYSVLLDNVEFARFAPSLFWSDMAKTMQEMYGDSFSYVYSETF